jgi:hypothetical protein
MYPEAHLNRSRRLIARHREQANKKYEEWMDLSKVDFKLLTEKEWTEACVFFGGCAICGSEHIETRHFFVDFREGGRYTAWNVFPMCGDCSKKVRNYKNPFVWLDKYIGSIDMPKERIDRMLEYFLMQIERVKPSEQ